MHRFYFFAVLTVCMGGMVSLHAQDMIIMKDGNVIEAKIMEIHPTEIRYKRFDNLNGPMVFLPSDRVLSIKYENGIVEIINPVGGSPASGQGSVQPGGQAAVADSLPPGQIGAPTPLQRLLNTMPAIPVAGNNLKFEFGGNVWVAKVNGESFSAGTIEIEDTEGGCILTLKQTHIWPGAVGKTAGRVAGMAPGGAAVGGALNTAGNIAGVAGAVEAPGTETVLEYRAGPPAKLQLVRTGKTATETADGQYANAGQTSEKTANVRNNWISFELALIGFGVRYERMLNSNISLGTSVYLTISSISSFGIVCSHFEINAFFRWYPWGKTFFLGTGLGYNLWTRVEYGVRSYDNLPDIYNFPGPETYRIEKNYNCFAIIPEIGWKIDVGKPGGFYLMPCITPGLVLGDGGGTMSKIFYFGMGGAF